MKLKLSELHPNTGQIEGVPTNPRTITEKDFEDLKDSLTRNPGNIKKFPLVIAEHKKQYVVISGNQRLRAMKALGWTELDHVGEIYPEGTDPEILQEAVIIANTHKGEWDFDLLANEWDGGKLEEWGIENTDWDDSEINLNSGDELREEYSQKLGEVIYEPRETNHKISDIYQRCTDYDKEIEQITNKPLKEMLKARVAFFDRFDFPKIADYYAYQATPEEQRIFEKLALVLLDKDQLIEHGFSELISDLDL